MTRTAPGLLAALFLATTTAPPFASRPIPATSAKQAQDRVERLSLLANIWGDVFLFHPNLVTNDLDFGQVLEHAIPSVEQAATKLDFVAAINRDLLGPLNDPLTFAFIESETPAVARRSALSAQMLDPSTGYIALPDPATFDDSAFIPNLSRTIGGLGSMRRLVIDARWLTPSNNNTEWLRLWVDSAIAMGHLVSRQHMGWREDPTPWADPTGFLTEQRWVAKPTMTLSPLSARLSGPYAPRAYNLPVVRTPTLVLVNRVSYPALEHALDALQRPGRLAVALERRGSPTEGGQVIAYAGGLRLHLKASVLVSHSGALGGCADAVEDSLPISKVPRLAEAVLGRAAGPCAGRPAFDGALRLPATPSAETAPLTRERRLYGLFKVYAVLTHLYPDRAVVADWPRRLPGWIADAEGAQSPRAYAGVLQEMAVTLRDAHAGVAGVGGYNAQRDTAAGWMIPARIVRARDGRAVIVQLARVDDPNAADGRSMAANPFKVGDEVVRIDGKTIDAIVAGATPQIAAANPSHLERELSDGGWLGTLGGFNSPARVEVRRADGSTREFTVARNHRGWGAHLLYTAGMPAPQILDGNIGYLPLGALDNPSRFDSLKAAMQNTNGLIVDNRAWRNGAVDYDLVRGWLWATSDTLPNGSNISEIPIADFAGEAISVGRVRQDWPPFIPANYNVRGEYYTKPIVLLIGPVQSEAEAVPITVRIRHRGIIVGTATAGTTGNSNSIALPGGGRFNFSTFRVLNPDGSLYNHVGVLPDSVVVPTVEGIRAGRDEALEAGLVALRRRLSKP